jgi:hypothetical protein
MAAFGGDVQALSETVFGSGTKPDPRPTAIGNLDTIAADAIRRTGEVPTFVTIENFGRADAKVTTFHNPKAGDIEPVTLLYDGATAAFERVKPSIGTQPSTGGTLAGIMAPLHFGNFAGILSKAVWFGLGFAMCYVTLTGLRLWLARRRKGARSLEWLERTVTVVGFGLPFALVATAAAFLVAMPIGTAVFWTPAGFLIAAGGAILCGAFLPSAIATRMLQLATGLTMIVLPALRLAMGGPGWSGAIAAGQPIIPAGDCAFLLAGAWMIWRLLGSRPLPDERTGDLDLPALQPAE